MREIRRELDAGELCRITPEGPLTTCNLGEAPCRHSAQ